MSTRLRLVVVLVIGSVVGAGAFGAVTSTGAEVTTTTVLPVSTITTAPTTTALVAVTSTTVTAPSPTTAARDWLVIQGVGDANFDPDYIPAFRTRGYEHAFSGLDGIFENDDLTVFNLECAPSSLGAPLDKAFTFRCDPDALEVMFDYGVDVVNLANNHSQDFGIEAMLDGRSRAGDAGLAAVGVGESLAEATAPALFELNGWTVAVLGMGGVVPSASWLATQDSPGMASGDDIDQMVAAVAAAKEVADIVVVTIHWGWELDMETRDDDRLRAKAMIAAGADIIFGHHQHRLNPLEIVDGRPVAWGLGNFVWPRLSAASARTAIARVVISPEGDFTACLIPAVIESSGHPVITGRVTCGPPSDETPTLN